MHHKAPNTHSFMTIVTRDLVNVTGGSARVTSRSSGNTDALMLQMTQLGDSIKQVAASKNQQDPMAMMLPMMMMMGGGGGGGGQQQVAAAAPPPPAAPSISIRNSIRG